uniref:Uncharacterized protein n=1 Tax=Anguilla anguilla TaxID=7936 RepID=A0A0E9UFP5_ANGAN
MVSNLLCLKQSVFCCQGPQTPRKSVTGRMRYECLLKRAKR